MKLTLAEPKYFKDSIAIISELVSEARFKITKNAIELVAMDPANVAMVIFKLFSSTFTEYDVKEDLDIAINLSNLKQILRRAKADYLLVTNEHNTTLSFETEDLDYLEEIEEFRYTIRGKEFWTRIIKFNKQ